MFNTLYYNVVKRARPGKSSGDGMVYYPHPHRPGTCSLDDIADSISNASTLSRADVHGVLVALSDEVASRVSQGYVVELGHLGRFKLNLKTELEDAPEKVAARSITGTRLNFLPSKYLKQRLAQIRFLKKR